MSRVDLSWVVAGLPDAASMPRRQVEQSVVRQVKRYVDSWRINGSRHGEAANARQDKPLAAPQRAQLRHLVAVNPFARKMLNTLINNAIGYGITGAPSGTAALKKLWKDWLAVCDYDEVLDFYGIQELAASTMFVDGEVFIIKHWVPDAAVMPLRLQVLDVDMLDMTTSVANARIRDGIEYGANNRPVAYYFKASRELADAATPLRYDAKDVIHLFRRERAGQWRGRSFFEAAVGPATDVDEYLEAEGVRKKIEACFAAFVTQTDNDLPQTPLGRESDQSSTIDDVNGRPPREAFEPGMIEYLMPGEDIKFGEPKAVGGFGDFVRWGALRMSAAAGVMYEAVTGDLSNINFSSFKAGQNEFKRSIGRLQWITLIPRLCDPVWVAFRDCAVAIGKGGNKQPAISWTPPAFESVDQGKDAAAFEKMISLGIESRRNLVGERGLDYEQHMQQLAADKKFEEGLGLSFEKKPENQMEVAENATTKPNAD